MSGDSETSPVWKKLYHVISGGNTTVTGDVVEEILRLCKDKIINCFLEYAPYTRKSFKSWKRHLGVKAIVEDDEMCNFIHLLSRELNLDSNVVWTIMCNFLMFEYFGKIDELKSIIRYDTNVRYLIDNVWYFYSADRMFLLKSLRHIFEYATDRDYKFYNQFNEFINSVDMKILWKNLIKTLEKLINEIDKDKASLVSSDLLKKWIHRNNREQVEVVTLLIHTIQFHKLEGNELEEVLTLFLKHGFARHLFYPESNSISRPTDLWEIKCAEIGCVLAVIERYWYVIYFIVPVTSVLVIGIYSFRQCPGIAKTLPKDMEKNLELLQIQGDNSIVLFTWSILKTSISNSDDAMEYCNRIICDLVQKRIFKSFHSLLTAKMFEKCRSGDIVIEGVFRVMAEFIKICADYTYLHEQDGVCHVTAELLKRKGLVVLDYLGPIFQLSMDAFPFVFNPFLEMCKSMLAIPEQHDKIMRLLQRIPSFLAEIPWNDHRQSFTLVGTQQLFIDSDLFIIPEGTLVEKFTYQGMDFARFIYPFSFFTLMEQFLKSLNVITFEIGKSWYCYDNLTELVKIGFRFIIDILKYYTGDFRSDVVLRRLLQRLEIVPTQFCDGPMKNFSLIRLYFETNITLITSDLLDFLEVFSLITRKKVFPECSSYRNVNKQVLRQFYYDSILFKSLKEEEGMRDHNLLVEYLKLIKYMVENDKYQDEVQVAGIWYILNVAFPLHQQWSYDDDFEMMTICKLCITIFVKVLQKTDVDETHKSFAIVTMVRDAFMFEEVLMSSYISVFYKDKFYIQTLMEQESNWINGPVLERIENIRLQMVLLLLLYKFRATLPTSTKCTIDDKISAVTTAVSAHMVNPYNANLRILAYRFLEILARDESIPMMALLGLDYDQVQRVFLDKLRDPMEDDNVKMQILELISTCIFSQHGMTAALFNVSRPRKWYSDFKEKRDEGDTVTDFMIDYLQNIKKSHEYLKSPLQVAILKVMANLWLSRKRHLIKDIISLEAFWPLLADPLFQDYNHSPSVYAYLFKILGTELDDTVADKKKQFFATVEKFFTDDKLMEQWQKYMIKTLSNSQLNPDEVQEKEFLILSWTEFILVAEKVKDLKKNY
ncbi:hypothetical protein NQ315_010240 [Exocentrus adspersus]|uniref:Uncharacterized protein n=1 Tax=Exocentrus adspersus TaxID=1586481 RepID=A0AAV8WCB9_9CUCU|nr:hypothetical protein NQ315_010240 [Exocentrus adspersus]